MNSRYRCATCRHYFSRPAFRTVGFQNVCSDDCLHGLRSTKLSKPSSKSSYRGEDARDVTPATRSEVLERDARRCRWCGTTSGVQLHHIDYRSHGGSHDPDNLIALCPEHHAAVHADKRHWQPLLQAYIVLRRQGRAIYLLDLERR